MAPSSWWEAVMTDGKFVMYQATTRLYKGGRLHPKRYFEFNPGLGGRQGYMTAFVYAQRCNLESYPSHEYNIKEAASEFDISLHWAFLKKLCGLEKTDDLYKSLQQIHIKRNEIAHHCGSDTIDETNLDENLDSLLKLYMKTLSHLETHTGESLFAVKRDVRERIESKKNGMFHCLVGNRDSGFRRDSAYCPDPENDEPAIGTFGKVAIGTAVGIGVLGVAAAIMKSTNRTSESNNKDTKKNETSKSGSEECVVM